MPNSRLNLRTYGTAHWTDFPGYQGVKLTPMSALLDERNLPNFSQRNLQVALELYSPCFVPTYVCNLNLPSLGRRNKDLL